jgi:hypothetical protein
LVREGLVLLRRLQTVAMVFLGAVEEKLLSGDGLPQEAEIQAMEDRTLVVEDQVLQQTPKVLDNPL